MNLQTVFCPNMACRDKYQIGKGNIVSHGKARQRCKCKSCGHTFSYRQGTMFYGLRTNAKIVTWAVGLMAWGCLVAAIVAVFEVDERYSTTEAIASGAKDADAASACIILEQFLRSLP